MKHHFKIVAVVLAGLVLAVYLIGAALMRHSLPDHDGTRQVTGLDGRVRLERDVFGIPHIKGESWRDIHFALGYAHAQDRLWQMEINRRIGHGRLAEVVGRPGIAIDRYFRTLGFTQAAKSAWAAMEDTPRAALTAYAAGVNAFLGDRRTALPPEFTLLDVTPEPWSPVDSLVWQKMMWLDLSGNMRHELARARLLTRLSPRQVEAIYPPYPGSREAPLPALEDIYDDLPVRPEALDRLAAHIGPPPEAGYGSNNWVVSGARTKSGKPLLANDPHLGLSTPSIWYLVRLHNTTSGENQVGVSFPGAPGVVLGRNDHLAWGFTNVAADVQDLYVEKLTDDGQVLTPAGKAPLKTRTEMIRVRGGDPINLTVRATRHGPLISDAMEDVADLLRDEYALSLRWTALDETDSGLSALLAMGRAADVSAFKAAARRFDGPAQNIVYADREGTIGHIAPARVPVRAAGNPVNGRLPSPGWDARYDWQGFLPKSALPERENPADGLIATANEKIVGESYPHYLTRDWALPYRGNRIRHLLRATPKHDLASFTHIQQDTVSDMARDILPHMLAHLDSSGPAVERLLAWDADMATDSSAALIFQRWLRHYQDRLMADELGDLYDDFRRIRPRLVKASLYWARPEPDTGPAPYYSVGVISKASALDWCDDRATEVTETCPDLARAAFQDALDDLTSRFGPNMDNWTWGRMHILTQSHRPLGPVPILGGLFQISGPQSGGRFTINVGGNGNDPDMPHRSGFGPSYRGIFDLAEPDTSLYVQPTGQSGHPLSENHDDLYPLWRDGRYVQISTAPAAPLDPEAVLVLEPAIPAVP
ncbi:penicillin acylase family protein [Yunchengibacter salinarum]|uniref:penicillin acylase family protein n=1 Tax=Yunchengibacter salinarum TaxID=3133399 RepID=UPI0035B61EA9